MTEQEIIQNAEKYAGNSAKHLQQPYEEYKLRYDAYIAGAHSRDKEIDELKLLHDPWINAVDRLPKTKEDSPSGVILAMCNDSYDLDDTHSSITCLIPCIFIYIEVDENVYQWESVMYDIYGYEVEDISKWMPIPKSNKGE